MAVGVPHVVFPVLKDHFGWVAAGYGTVMIAVIKPFQLSVFELGVELVVLWPGSHVPIVVSLHCGAEGSVGFLFGELKRKTSRRFFIHLPKSVESNQN